MILSNIDCSSSGSNGMKKFHKLVCKSISPLRVKHGFILMGEGGSFSPIYASTVVVEGPLRSFKRLTSSQTRQDRTDTANLLTFGECTQMLNKTSRFWHSQILNNVRKARKPCLYHDWTKLSSMNLANAINRGIEAVNTTATYNIKVECIWPVYILSFPFSSGHS